MLIISRRKVFDESKLDDLGNLEGLLPGWYRNGQMRANCGFKPTAVKQGIPAK